MDKYNGTVTEDILDTDFKMPEHLDKLLEASKPLMKYLAENHNPHTQAIVTSTGVEVVEGVLNIQNMTEFIKD